MMFYLCLFYKKFQKKVKTNMDPIFEYPISYSCRERVKFVARLQEKPAQTFSDSMYTCFICGSNNVFSVVKQVRSADEGKTVFNECRDCHK